MGKTGDRPQRRHRQREEHRLEKHPEKAKIMPPVAVQDLAHEQRTDHPKLDRQGFRERGLFDL